MSYVLLLTSTIHPFHAEMKFGRYDAVAREDDYFKAVSFYLSRGFRVVFVDNSDTRSDRILALDGDGTKLEYFAFPTQKSYLGKSNGEVEIIDYALSHSELLRTVDYVVKITGRYIIKNLREILDATHGVSKEVYINPTRNLRWADSRLMVMRKSYYSHFFRSAVDRYLDETEKVYMENVLMKSVLMYLLEGGELALWPAYPAYEAYDGSLNEKVTFGFFKQMKYNAYYKLKTFVFRHRV